MSSMAMSVGHLLAFYECAGFDIEVMEKELKSMSEEALIHHVLIEM